MAVSFRAYYATAVFPTQHYANQERFYTNALYGFVGMLIKTIGTIKLTHILVAFDTKAKTFRHEELDYKAQRKPMPEELAMQIPAIKDFLMMGIKRLKSKATKVTTSSELLPKSEKANYDVIIAKGDKDMLQLVDNNVQVYLTRHGVSELEAFNVDNFRKDAIYPSQVVDFKALTGDNRIICPASAESDRKPPISYWPNMK